MTLGQWWQLGLLMSVVNIAIWMLVGGCGSSAGLLVMHDVLILGAGLAGQRAALAAAETGASVVLVSKVHPVRSHSVAAAGGINASVGKGDTWEAHALDTTKGSDYLGDQDTIEVMCREAPGEIAHMERLGVPFHRNEHGRLATRPFGAARPGSAGRDRRSLGNQCCARVAARIDVVERAGQNPPRDVGRVGTHHHDEDELRVPRRAIGQVVGKQEALARARGDDAPAISDRLHIHRRVMEVNLTMLAPPIPRGSAAGASVERRHPYPRPLQRPPAPPPRDVSRRPDPHRQHPTPELAHA